MSLVPIFRNDPRINVNDPFTMDIWDPFTTNDENPMHASSQFPFNSNNSIITPPFGGGGGVARFEWRETPEAHVLSGELPEGFRKEEVKVEVEDGKNLIISGEKEVEREEKHENWHHFERREGKFLKSYSLPEKCKSPDHIRASLENGIITVTVPKLK